MSNNSFEEKLAHLLQLSVQTGRAGELEQLADMINDLIVQDFEKLVRILYRVDVDENKLKKVLGEHPGEDAGFLIARLLVERQKQKEDFKKKFRNNTADIPDDERWDPDD